jgi:sec-independent protein translocase protein TatA
MLGTWEIIVIVLAILLLFGGKKIPELMHGVGKGVKSFKDGMNGVEDNKPESPDSPEKPESSKQ